ncbi:hypothetical protein VNI00_003389 [Paramarasmius palmivorus]|uniref:TEA domain-containing protein n=1 Tax=Paramarasmius palmivorus TaxID=297713 RepID=A0AAW0DQK0_9AGAR
MSSASSTLTPSRKHRKLLKDGSGEEVWPEHVERFFYQGLQVYAGSTLAAASTGGRSRYRNQFLVEFLASRGIVRTKKQVASHLQVLRGMWKGEKEYRLVAGVDEPEYTGPFDSSDSDFSSSPASMTSFNTSLPESPFSVATTIDSSPLFNEDVKMEEPQDYLNTMPDSKHSSLSHSPHTHVSNSLSNVSPPQQPYRVTAFTLHIPQITPFRVFVDGLMPPPSSEPLYPAVLKVLLAPNNNQFEVEVEMSRIGSLGGFSKSKMYRGGSKVADTRRDLDLNRIALNRPVYNAGTVHILPGNTMTQEFVMDGEVLMYLVYELDNSPGAAGVRLDRWQRYRTSCPPNDRKTSAPPSSHAMSPTVSMLNAAIGTRRESDPVFTTPDYSIPSSYSPSAYASSSILPPSDSYAHFAPVYDNGSPSYSAISASAPSYAQPSIPASTSGSFYPELYDTSPLSSPTRASFSSMPQSYGPGTLASPMPSSGSRSSLSRVPFGIRQWPWRNVRKCSRFAEPNAYDA